MLCNNPNTVFTLADVSSAYGIYEEPLSPCSTLRLKEICEPILKGIRAKEKWKVTKALATFDQKQVPEIVRAVEPLFKGMNQANDRVKFLKTVALIPKEDRIQLLIDIKPYLERLNSSYDKCELLKSLHNHDPAKRKIYLKQGLPFLGKKDSSIHQVHLIEELQQFQTPQDWCLLDDAKKLMNCEMSLKDRVDMIQRMKKVPIDLRKDFFSVAEILVQSVKLKNRSDMLSSILQENHPFILQKMRAVLEFGREHSKNPLSPGFLLRLMQCPDEKSSYFLKIGHSLILLKELEKPLEFFSALTHLDVEELRLFSSWLEIYQTPHRKKGRALCTYLSHTRILMKESITYLLTLDPKKSLAGVHADFFLIYLEEHESQQDLVAYIAEYVINQYEQLQISEESPLFFKAMEIYLLNDIFDPNDPLNPYIIFQDHVKRAAKTLYLRNPSVLLDGKEYMFNLKTALQQSQLQSISSADLDKGVDPQIFSNAFTDLEERLLCLDSVLHRQILGRIQETTGLLFSQLKENLFDPFFETALSFPLKKSSNVPIHAVKLLQIALWFQSIPNRAGDIEGLSEQESALVQISASIANCSEGKRMGVHRAYKFLPDTFRKQNVSSCELDFLSAFAYSQLILMIEFQLEQESLVKELLRPKVIHKIQELPHHQTFIRNKISRFLGLPHSVVFDAHTGVLIKGLVFVHEQKMLDIFFRMFRPEQLLEKLCSHYLSLPEEAKRSIFNQLNEHASSDQLEDFWNLDAPTISMTPRGALELLMMLKIFYPKKDQQP